jgi:uncharacterized protein YcbX
MNNAARIAALHYYPLKSARGVELERALLTSAGFADDRRWMLVTNAGRCITQREVPRLALIRPWLSASELVLRAPAVPEISLAFARALEPCQVNLWSESCRAFDEGDAAASWLQAFLGRDCRLVRFDPAQRRLSSRTWTGELQADNRFTDGFPLLAVSLNSLGDLNRRLAEPLPMNRFRANIVLDGLQPYDEDHIDELSAAGIRLKLVKPCTHGRIAATNQDTGQIEGDEPLRTLQGYRYDAALHGVCFGQNGIIVEGMGATLTRGQALSVRWRAQLRGEDLAR